MPKTPCFNILVNYNCFAVKAGEKESVILFFTNSHWPKCIWLHIVHFTCSSLWIISLESCGYEFLYYCHLAIQVYSLLLAEKLQTILERLLVSGISVKVKSILDFTRLCSGETAEGYQSVLWLTVLSSEQWRN